MISHQPIDKICAAACRSMLVRMLWANESALSLFVLRVLADDADGALPLDDFALFTHWFYGRSDLHS
jgi:hypothetical protein